MRNRFYYIIASAFLLFLSCSTNKRGELGTSNSQENDVATTKIEALKELQQNIKDTRASLPMYVEEGLLLTDIYMDEGKIYYKYSFDESEEHLTKADSQKMHALILANIRQGVNDVDITSFFYDVVKVDLPVVYRFIGEVTHYEILIEIKSKEIQEIYKF